MRGILRESNLDLLREIDNLRDVIGKVSGVILQELRPFHAWVIANADHLQQQVIQNLRDLDLNEDSILPDLLSTTQEVTRNFHIFNQRLVSPVLRATATDRLCLKLLRWLHLIHPQTRGNPVGLSDGEFSIWPVPQLPIIYSMPSSAQHGLLYLPLFFHEFGHLLYACHKAEMDDLVRGLQEAIADALIPNTQRNDLHAQEDLAKRTAIVETWFEWTQEFFCDAVGYTVGGSAFGNAFSMYMRMRGPGEYHERPEDLVHRPHPVTWLRVHLISDRARRIGRATDAGVLERPWNKIAESLGISEDYYGLFDPDFLPEIRRTIDDMLTEAAPRHFSEEEVSLTEAGSPPRSPVHLLNQAWHRFWNAPGNYHEWERGAVENFLAIELTG